MTRTATRLVAVASAAFLFSGLGPRIALRREDETGTEAVLERFEEHHTEVKGLLDAHGKKLDGTEARLTEIEQKMDRRPGGGGGPAEPTWGHALVESKEFEAWGRNGFRGSARIEVKALTSVSAGALVAPDYQPGVTALPRRQGFVRQILAPGSTTSNTVYFVQMTSRTNNATAVAENPAAPKPQSDFTLVGAQAPVRTIAHWIKVSKQILEDAAGLASLIDSELRDGLGEAEEQQILLGDGTGVNLFGILPQASVFAVPSGFTIASPTMVDVLLQAIAQSELALLPATGIVLNPLDFRKILALKDSTGRYIGGGPFAALEDRIWDLPKICSPVMPQNNFLVGAFTAGAQIFDRTEVEVIASSEDQDNFTKNMVTVLAERRLALAVKRPTAFIKGTFS